MRARRAELRRRNHRQAGLRERHNPRVDRRLGEGGNGPDPGRRRLPAHGLQALPVAREHLEGALEQAQQPLERGAILYHHLAWFGVAPVRDRSPLAERPVVEIVEQVDRTQVRGCHAARSHASARY